jgi:hypothetical protein
LYILLNILLDIRLLLVIYILRHLLDEGLVVLRIVAHHVLVGILVVGQVGLLSVLCVVLHVLVHDGILLVVVDVGREVGRDVVGVGGRRSLGVGLELLHVVELGDDVDVGEVGRRVGGKLVERIDESGERSGAEIGGVGVLGETESGVTEVVGRSGAESESGREIGVVESGRRVGDGKRGGGVGVVVDMMKFGGALVREEIRGGPGQRFGVRLEVVVRLLH